MKKKLLVGVVFLLVLVGIGIAVGIEYDRCDMDTAWYLLAYFDDADPSSVVSAVLATEPLRVEPPSTWLPGWFTPYRDSIDSRGCVRRGTRPYNALQRSLITAINGRSNSVQGDVPRRLPGGVWGKLSTAERTMVIDKYNNLHSRYFDIELPEAYENYTGDLKDRFRLGKNIPELLRELPVEWVPNLEGRWALCPGPCNIAVVRLLPLACKKSSTDAGLTNKARILLNNTRTQKANWLSRVPHAVFNHVALKDIMADKFCRRYICWLILEVCDDGDVVDILEYLQPSQESLQSLSVLTRIGTMKDSFARTDARRYV